MKKRATLITTGCALAVFACALFWLWRPKDPRYMGKTLVEWIEQTQPTSVTNSAGQREEYFSFHNQKELQGALRAMGSNAVPILIELFEREEPFLSQPKIYIVNAPRVPQSIKATLAEGLNDSHTKLAILTGALGFLGDDALSAIPELERIAADPDRSITPPMAIFALARFDLKAIPALERCRTNVPVIRRKFVEHTIFDIYRRGANSSDDQIREVSALALAESPRPPFEIVLTLVELLASPNLETRRRAMNGLARHLPTLAPSLVAAYHAVEKQTTDDDPEMRRIATELLAKLNPPPPGKKP